MPQSLTVTEDELSYAVGAGDRTVRTASGSERAQGQPQVQMGLATSVRLIRF
jgi:hypothetical protein